MYDKLTNIIIAVINADRDFKSISLSFILYPNPYLTNLFQSEFSKLLDSS